MFFFGRCRLNEEAKKNSTESKCSSKVVDEKVKRNRTFLTQLLWIVCGFWPNFGNVFIECLALPSVSSPKTEFLIRFFFFCKFLNDPSGNGLMTSALSVYRVFFFFLPSFSFTTNQQERERSRRFKEATPPHTHTHNVTHSHTHTPTHGNQTKKKEPNEGKR